MIRSHYAASSAVAYRLLTHRLIISVDEEDDISLIALTIFNGRGYLTVLLLLFIV